jgi:predicted nucleic-acid-binding protein
MPRNRFQMILKFLYVFDHSRNVSRQVIQNFINSLIVNGFQDFIILECLLAIAALALIILLA